MKLTAIKALLASVACLISFQVSFASGMDWTKETQVLVSPKVSKDADKPVILGEGAVSFVLGNGAVGFFPEASADELRAIEEDVGIAFTVYNRFRVIATLVNKLDLGEAEYMASQKVPTQKLLDLAQLIVNDDVSSNWARAALADLSAEHSAYVQYRLDKD